MRYRIKSALLLAAGLFVTALAGAQETLPSEVSQPEKDQTVTDVGGLASESDGAAKDAAKEPTEEAKKEAAERFQRGLSFYEDGDYGLALIEFERAYELVPDYRVLYNIGQVSIQLAHSSQALRALREYLEKGGESLSEERVTSVKRDLEMLHARTAHLSLTGTEGAEVVIDEESYGTLPLDTPLLLDAGRHKIEVKKEGFRSFNDRLTLAGAEERRLSVELEQNPAEAPLVARPPENREPKPLQPIKAPVAKQSTPWPVIGWSATGALAGGAILSGVMGLSASSKFRELRSEPDPSRSELGSQAKTAKTWFLAADILTATAVATGGVTLYVTLRSQSVRTQSGDERAAADWDAQSSASWRVNFFPSAVSVSRDF